MTMQHGGPPMTLRECMEAEEVEIDLWQALLADCNKVPCDYPCLRDDLGDWLTDMAKRHPALKDYAERYVHGDPSSAGAANE